MQSDYNTQHVKCSEGKQNVVIILSNMKEQVQQATRTKWLLQSIYTNIQNVASHKHKVVDTSNKC